LVKHPERWTFKQGDARESLRQLQGVEFDYVHIDTGHDEPFIKWYTTSILGAFARDNKVPNHVILYFA